MSLDERVEASKMEHRTQYEKPTALAMRNKAGKFRAPKKRHGLPAHSRARSHARAGAARQAAASRQDGKKEQNCSSHGPKEPQGQDITEEMVRKATTMRQHSTEEKAHFFEKITNLSLHGRRIRAIRNLHMCTNLRVLFLYSNCIERIENLSFAKNLTHLYLENNRIRRIEDLANLAHLTKLSLDGNCISTLEGLEGCSSLTELHLSNQRLELGQTFEFDPQSIAGLADSLQLLTVANSQVESIAPLGGLANLQILRAPHNPHLAGGVDSLEELVKGCVFLQEVDFADTPLAATPNYRDTLIAKSEYVSLIDGKLVQPNQREFLQARARRRTLGRTVKPHLGATGKGLTQSLTANMDVVGSSTLLRGSTSTTTSSNNQDSQASFGSTPSVTTHFTASSVPGASSGLARPRLSLVARNSMSSRLPSRTLSSSAESQLLQASFSGFLNAKPVSLEHCR